MIKNARLNISMTVGNELVEIPVEVNIDPLFYDPEFVLVKFFDQGSTEYSKNFERAVNLIFMGSMSFNTLLEASGIILDPTSLNKDMMAMIVRVAALARKYTECYATYWFGIRYYGSSFKSVSKSKTLGDVQVSYSTDSQLDANQIVADSKKCIDEIAQQIKNIGLSGVGRCNSASFRNRDSNVKYRPRVWDWRQVEYGVPNAGTKIMMPDGKLYKTGSFYQYWHNYSTIQGWTYDAWQYKSFL